MCKLHHYTGEDAFFKITKTKSMRMSRSDSFSDPGDCRIFYSLVGEFLLVRNDPDNYDYYAGLMNRDVLESVGGDVFGFIGYLDFLYARVPIYVLSFSKSDDELVMWNSMGFDPEHPEALELTFSEEELMAAFREKLHSDDEFLAIADVVYVDDEPDIFQLSLPNLSKFVLHNRNSKDIFSDHKKYVGNCRNEDLNVGDADKLATYIRIFYRDYLVTLDYLLNKNIIGQKMSSDEVYEAVFTHILQLPDYVYAKKDLPLYMLVLSAMFKSQEYSYENERRIVYFQYNINEKKEITEVKSESPKRTLSGEYMDRFYIQFEDLSLNTALKNVLLSPYMKCMDEGGDIHEALGFWKYLMRLGYSPETWVDFSYLEPRWR